MAAGCVPNGTQASTRRIPGTIDGGKETKMEILVNCAKTVRPANMLIVGEGGRSAAEAPESVSGSSHRENSKQHLCYSPRDTYRPAPRR